VQLISRYGQVRVRALVTDRVRWRAVYADELTGEPRESPYRQHTDPVTKYGRLQRGKRPSQSTDELAKARCRASIALRASHTAAGGGSERKWRRPDTTFLATAWFKFNKFKPRNKQDMPTNSLEVAPRQPAEKNCAPRLERAPEEHAEASCSLRNCFR